MSPARNNLRNCNHVTAPAIKIVIAQSRVGDRLEQHSIREWTYNKPGVVSVWVAYVYWHNKFGIDHNLDPTGGSIESTGLVGGTVAF